MDAAIRWSPHSSLDDQRFLVADVSENRLSHYRVTGTKGRQLEYECISSREKLPNYSAFDWSREDENIVATGDGLGTIRIIELDPTQKDGAEYLHTHRINQQRKCNSLSFSTANLLAAAFDKARTDTSINIYDLNSNDTMEPIRKLANADNGEW